jgi:hypothetical protein
MVYNIMIYTNRVSNIAMLMLCEYSRARAIWPHFTNIVSRTNPPMHSSVTNNNIRAVCISIWLPCK